MRFPDLHAATKRLARSMFALTIAGSVLHAIKPSNSDILDLERFSTLPATDLEDLADVSTPPAPKLQVRPEFPGHLQMGSLQVEVLVGFIVDSSGSVPEAHAIRSNNPWFEREALETVRKWHFEPGRINGRAVNTRMQVPIHFQLDSPGKGAWAMRIVSDTSTLPTAFRFDNPPRALETTFAAYPLEALLANRDANVGLNALIDAEGKVAHIVFNDAPDNAFAGAVRAMLDRWRFKPATMAGEPVTTVVFLEFVFSSTGDISCAPVSPSAKVILKELQSTEPRVLTLSDLDAPPRLIAQHPPAHPPSLHSAGIGGEALVEIFIDEEGSVQLPRVVESTRPEFGYAAAQTVSTWWFEPPLREGKPVTVRTRVSVVFEIKDQISP